jgi:fumarate hydratase class I
MELEKLAENLLTLITRASVELPTDVTVALRRAQEQASPDATEAQCLATILDNVALAQQKKLPICQDTGTLFFQVAAPSWLRRRDFEQAAAWAISEATKRGVLRQNCVNALSGCNTGNNLGYGSPQIHWHESEEPDLRVTLMLKGGGSENMGAQYSLPDQRLQAGRDLDGVRRCILDAVWRAQGQGCAPGILGVAFGGDRCSSYEESKLQLLRRVGQRSPEPELAALEERVLSEANSLGIGSMGFGGKTTLLEVFIGWRCRLPASFFVSISYMCWCCRRQTMLIKHGDI